MRDEENLEAEIQAKGLNAPRLTPALIDGKIASNWFINPPFTALTICVLTLANGFHVTGESAAASLENFDRAIGEKIAFEKAREKIWMLEGYLLREHLSMASEIAGSRTKPAGSKRRVEIVTRDITYNCWRNETGDVVCDIDVVRQGDFHIRIVPDVPLGDDKAGKIIGHDRSEEGDPPFNN